MSRKTFSVLDFQERINRILASDSVSQMEKRGLCNALEMALLETGNYAGFAFNADHESPTFQEDTDVFYHDETDTFSYGKYRFNRFYFIHRNLRK